MKIIVTGANGFLAQHLCRMLVIKGFEVHALARGESRLSYCEGIVYHAVELTDVSRIDAVFSLVQPHFVIHAAAMSKPDECFDQPEKCLLHNVEVTRYLLHTAQQYNSFFIYISTDFIFGDNGPHSEDDLPQPLNFYGESKLMAENLVNASGLDTAIVRPVFIYGEQAEGMRADFLHWIRNHLQQQLPVKVVTDQWRTPTFAPDICNGIIEIITRKLTGAFHLAGPEILSPYEMALTVARLLQLDESLITPVTADTFPERVKRAKRSGLKIDKARKLLGYNPVLFEEGVRRSFGL
ncbi:SDR family oxidoreductase [Sediminibacterium ginsengisoli]|uniref:dTDP-4-dehydrorhamnose reductase n=1 Tax=Sediminibacterium ginsengisoli TaxID=413434 RepID=A0A1T4R899_9BACT|nr:SDR family oxidoreductase [Sediminibacterium ginsengisoli]SKA12159.1 dTDP-4-dehydrorhamnose reductase [Sediminibacterium ginsengisoli]